MMALVRKVLGIHPSEPEVRPITFRDVPPARRDPEIEARIREAQTSLVQDKMKLERRSWEVRQALAENVLNIVSGGESR